MRFALLVPLLGLLLLPAAVAQPAPGAAKGPAYEVPFASEGNSVRLTVANTTPTPLQGVRVRLADAPRWAAFEQKTVDLETLSVGKEAVARFSFAVTAEAPAGRKAALVFAVENAHGTLVAEKAVRVEVAAPETFALEGNYPNPFRERTEIGYQLPEAAEMTIRVYDALGRQVRRLEEGMQEAGGHAARLNSGNLSSGVYFYAVEVKTESGAHRLERGKMVLVR